MEIHHRSFELEAGIQALSFPCFSEWPVTNHWSSPIYTQKQGYIWTQTEALRSGNSCVVLIVKGLEASGIPPPALQCRPGRSTSTYALSVCIPSGQPKDHLPCSQHGNLTFHTGVRAARISWHFYISHCSKRYGQDLQSTFKRGIICI